MNMCSAKMLPREKRSVFVCLVLLEIGATDGWERWIWEKEIERRKKEERNSRKRRGIKERDEKREEMWGYRGERDTAARREERDYGGGVTRFVPKSREHSRVCGTAERRGSLTFQAWSCVNPVCYFRSDMEIRGQMGASIGLIRDCGLAWMDHGWKAIENEKKRGRDRNRDWAFEKNNIRQTEKKMQRRGYAWARGKERYGE